jgi:AcrR family transcriptional regulator
MTELKIEPLETIDLTAQSIAPVRAERKDAAEHRRRILATARELFEERGIDEVSMHQIALSAGVGQGTLYRRYAHKGQLCNELMRETWETFQAEVDAIANDSSRDPMNRLDSALDHMVRFVDANVKLLSAIHAADLNNPKDKKTDPGYLWMHGVVARLAALCIEAGEMPDLDPPFIADSILGALQNIYERHDTEYTPDQILDGVRRIFLRG